MVLAVRRAMTNWLWKLCASLLLACLLFGAEVRADCALPAPEIEWSYPAQGASDVPRDVRVRIIPRPEKVSLDGETLDSDDDEAFDPGRLAADTEYSLEVTFRNEVTQQLRFTTGDDLAEQSDDSGLEIGAITSEPEGNQAQGLCAPQPGCPDTPGYRVYTLELDTRSELEIPAYAVSTLSAERDDEGHQLRHTFVWPAECGDPKVLTFGEVDEGTCFRVQALGVQGRIGKPVKDCTPFDDGSGGCAVNGLGSGESSGWFPGLALVGVLLWRRRRVQLSS